MRIEFGTMSDPAPSGRFSIRRFLQRSLLVVGLLLLGIYIGSFLHRIVFSRLAVWKAERTVAHSASQLRVSESQVDFSLWDDKRIQEYKDSLLSKVDDPLAVLRIPKVRLVVPVFEGTDELTLNRGVGRIVGTAQIGEPGNVGIAGHRDGFFRVLKDVSVGDSIELTADGNQTDYAVTAIEIVNPTDTSVLRPSEDSELTLVTCYPFYFIGSAPQRFIVHASAKAQQHASQNSSAGLLR